MLPDSWGSEYKNIGSIEVSPAVAHDHDARMMRHVSSGIARDVDPLPLLLKSPCPMGRGVGTGVGSGAGVDARIVAVGCALGASVGAGVGRIVLTGSTVGVTVGVGEAVGDPGLGLVVGLSVATLGEFARLALLTGVRSIGDAVAPEPAPAQLTKIIASAAKLHLCATCRAFTRPRCSGTPAWDIGNRSFPHRLGTVAAVLPSVPHRLHWGLVRPAPRGCSPTFVRSVTPVAEDSVAMLGMRRAGAGATGAATVDRSPRTRHQSRDPPSHAGPP